MIDDELYKIAAAELNSDDRKADVWARACALASDDHDEARFLYTNLRVEEMLNKDGKQRTFSATRRSQDEDLSSADRLSTLELAPEGEPAPESGRTGKSNSDAPLPIDDIVGYDADNTSTPTSVAGNAQETTSGDAFDDESLAELDALTQENQSTNGALSGLTGQALEKPDSSHAQNQDEFTEDDFAVSDAVDDSRHNPLPQVEIRKPDAQYHDEHSEDLTQKLYDANDVARDDHTAVTAGSDELRPGQHESVRTDYADSDILEDDLTFDASSDLDTGKGRSYMVFNRNGVIKAIKRGVSWPALFFTFPWLLSKSLFGTALAYGCLWLVSLAGLYTTGIQWLNAGADAPLAIKLWTAGFALLVLIGLFYIPFRYGNRWVADKLQNKGFEFESAVSAVSKRDAVDRLFEPVE